MNTRHAIAIALIPILLGAGGASFTAQQLTLRPGMTGVPDLGAIECATFSHMYPAGSTGMRQAVLTWAQGYFYARTGKTTDEILAALPDDNPWDFDSLTDHIVDYCAANPDAPLPEAVVDLWGQLGSD